MSDGSTAVYLFPRSFTASSSSVCAAAAAATAATAATAAATAATTAATATAATTVTTSSFLPPASSQLSAARPAATHCPLLAAHCPLSAAAVARSCHPSPSPPPFLLSFSTAVPFFQSVPLLLPTANVLRLPPNRYVPLLYFSSLVIASNVRPSFSRYFLPSSFFSLPLLMNLIGSHSTLSPPSLSLFPCKDFFVPACSANFFQEERRKEKKREIKRGTITTTILYDIRISVSGQSKGNKNNRTSVSIFENSCDNRSGHR